MKKMKPICMFLMVIAMALSVFAVVGFSRDLKPSVPPTGQTMQTLDP